MNKNLLNHPKLTTSIKPVSFTKTYRLSPLLAIGSLSILLIVILGVGGHLIYQNYRLKNFQYTTPTFAPTPEQTASWKTYTNNSLGFSIEYPSDWSNVETYQQSTREAVYFDGNGNSEFNIVYGGYYDQGVLFRMLTFTEYLDRFFSDKPSEDFVLERMQGKRFIYKTSNDLIEDIIVAAESNSSTTFWVMTYKYSPDDSEAEGIYNQILSTFKRLDQNPN